MKEVILKLARYRLEGNILFATYQPNAEVDLEDAKFLLSERLKLTENIDHYTIIDLRNLKRATKEARAFFSTEAGSQGIIAGAFIVDSFLSKLIGNFYLKFSPPPRPTKLFSNEEDALDWIKSLIEGAKK